jgi:multidrug efflux system membrane fusion protein
VNVELTEGTQIILSGGVKPGDQIVVDGQEKLKNGSKVFPKVAPAKSGDGTTAELGMTRGTEQSS